MINVFTKIESVKKISYFLFFLVSINLFSSIDYQNDEVITDDLEISIIDFEKILSEPFVITPSRESNLNDN
jgi:hypothetical protein